MLIPPKYLLTQNISRLLAKIEASHEVIESTAVAPEAELNLRRKSTLKSSVFSARIEGNSTLLDDYPKLSPKNQKRIEINNILKAINWVQEKSRNEITTKDILTLHSISMKGIVSEELGKFRKKHEGIFTLAGTVIYHAPPPPLVSPLIQRLLKYANSDKETFIPVKALLSHYVFEKIHPFTDGSGRVGRLLTLLILTKDNFGFKGILPFEEKIDSRRETYYKMLQESERNVTDYLEFMLEVVSAAADEARQSILGGQTVESADLLLPRRGEILALIKDQKLINFENLKRRFRDINERTLRYDLKKLAENGFIQKLGITRGVYYKPKAND